VNSELHIHSCTRESMLIVY